MAQRIILVDDLDGTDAAGTVTFGLNGTEYEIDLSTMHTKELESVLQPFVEKARPRKGGKRRATNGTSASAAYTSSNPSRAERERNKQIRDWGNANGFDVPARGKIPENVREAFEAATV